MKKHSLLGVFQSKGRLTNEANSRFRSPFQRDRDRIVHSASFRRLKHKTQVFVNTEGDHYRTRITHSIEVAQIARSIAKFLKLNEDLAETLSLAHDMGHTPFGHAGEDALNECMHDHGGFDHNLQTLRIVMFLENKYFKFDGLNLTVETLEGLLKHNGPVENLSLVNRLIGLKSFKKKIVFNSYPSLEAQISSISDDIAYNNHDIQDGINAKLFKLEDLTEIDFFKSIYVKYRKKINKTNYKIATYQIIRDSIDLMIRDLLNNTQKNLKDNKITSFKKVTKTDSFLVGFSKKYTLRLAPSSHKFNHPVNKISKSNTKYVSPVFKRVRRIAYMATGKPTLCSLWSFPLAKAASTNGAGAGQPPTIAAAA